MADGDGLGDAVGVVLDEVLDGDGLDDEEVGDELGDGRLLGEVLGAGELARQLLDDCCGEWCPGLLD